MSQFESWAGALISGIEAINEFTGRLVSWLTLLMVLTTFAVVILRYVFDTGWIAMQESITYMHAVLFLVGTAYTLKHQGHVRVDIFFGKFSARGKAWVDLLGTLFLLIPVCLFILFVSWDYVIASWSMLESSQEAGGLGGVYLLKSMILVMASLLLLQGMAMILRSLIVIRR
ncbi:MAG: TRAP transporter small permease subunit [Candidatus Polarisedimenticolaceae bacterium]|nr:TRAP transporter small permease subunit [Candidatus Polarisedimenticolaceae bacterium]